MQFHSTLAPITTAPTTFQLLRVRRSIREHLSSLQCNLDQFNSILCKLKLRLLARVSNPYRNGTVAPCESKKGAEKTNTKVLSTLVKEALESEDELTRLRDLLKIIEEEAGDVMIRRDEMGKTMLDIQKERNEAEESERENNEEMENIRKKEEEEEATARDYSSIGSSSIGSARGRRLVNGMRKPETSILIPSSSYTSTSIPTFAPSNPVQPSPLRGPSSDTSSSSSDDDSDNEGLSLRRATNHKSPRRNATTSTNRSGPPKGLPRPKWVPKRIWDSDLEVDIYIHRQQVTMLQMQLLEVEELWMKVVGRRADARMSDLKITY